MQNLAFDLGIEYVYREGFINNIKLFQKTTENHMVLRSQIE